MSETAPAFTPSPGIPNVAHARYYEALAKETGGQAAPPKSQGQQFHTPSTLAKFAEIEKARAPKQPPASTGPTAESIKAYQDSKRNPKPTAQPYLDGTENNVKEFDAEMRATGQATGKDSALATAQLIALKRSTPLDKQTHQWKADWEAKYAAAVADGDQQPAAAEIVPAGTSPEAVQGVDALMKVMDSNGHAPVSAFSRAVTHGYTLPTLVAGQTYDAERLLPELAKARKAGISQAQVESYIREDMRSRGFKV